MADDLSFNALCKLLKQHQNEPSLLNAVDHLLGPLIVLAGLGAAVAGVPGAIAVAGSLLGPKNALTAAGKALFQRLTAKRYSGPLELFERMQAAYSLIAFTAFFDALGAFDPALRKAFGLGPTAQLELAKTAFESQAPSAATDGILDLEIPLPHPAEPEDEVLLKRIYLHLTSGYRNLVQATAAWDEAKAETRHKLESEIEKLPDAALARHRAQYVALARQFPEFFVWATLQEQARHRAVLKKISDYWKLHAEMTEAAGARIDLGFAELGRALQALPGAVAAHQYATVLGELARRYAARLDQPIVEEEYPNPPGAEPLRFPKRAEAYVPQAFRVLRATGRDHLEEEATWQSLDLRQDLGSFLLSYFSSPYSFRFPLLILGDPGSGKSLLTQMLAARLIGPQLTPIRVELRALEADEIAQQIEEQITRDTNGQKISWPMLNSHLATAPALVLLDGYDELLQASGQVYAGYLQSVRQFQDSERTLGRPPVRTVVTSRITLIDKTRLPIGTTVIRLEPFDKPRQESWVSIWNHTNADYFSLSRPRIERFQLPANDRQIAELAEQPLLLLMLAIYDSYANDLRKSHGLDRTRLYENLLRRFIDRELSKEQEFRSLDDRQQTERIEAELKRLGVVAISMFNRRSLLIKSGQLDLDLQFFDCARSRAATEGRALRQSEMLLGSFFFVHESRSSSKGSSTGEADVESAFQFLHNTFGEFLAARFLVDHVVAQVNKIHHYLQSPVLKGEVDRMLSTPAGLDLEVGWIASLIYTPLFSRPVILEMVREWLPHHLRGVMNPIAFHAVFDLVVKAELRRVLGLGQAPALMSQPGRASFAGLPLLGHLALYSCNLVVLRATVPPVPDGVLTIEEADYPTYEDGASPWDRLTHLWRAWFALDNLNALTAILVTERREGAVQLSAQARFATSAPKNRLESVRNVSRALGDGVLGGLAAIESWDVTKPDLVEYKAILQETTRAHLDLRVGLMTLLLRSVASSPFTDDGDLRWVARECLGLLKNEAPLPKTAEMLRALMAVPWIVEPEVWSEIGDVTRRLGENHGAFFQLALQETWEHQIYRNRGGLRVLPLDLLGGLAEVWAGDLDTETLLSRLISESNHLQRPFRPDIALALLRVALLEASETWPIGSLKHLWATSLHPEIVARFEIDMTLEALGLLPTAMGPQDPNDWLEFFQRAGRFGRRSRRNGRLMLAVAFAAAELDSGQTGELADRVVHTAPWEVFGVHRRRPDVGRVKRVLTAQPAVFAMVRKVIPRATDKEQAGVWMKDFTHLMRLESSSSEELSAGAALEILTTFSRLQIPPAELVARVKRRDERLPIDFDLCRLSEIVQNAVHAVQPLMSHLETESPAATTTRSRRPRPPGA